MPDYYVRSMSHYFASKWPWQSGTTVFLETLNWSRSSIGAVRTFGVSVVDVELLLMLGEDRFDENYVVLGKEVRISISTIIHYGSLISSRRSFSVEALGSELPLFDRLYVAHYRTRSSNLLAHLNRSSSTSQLESASSRPGLKCAYYFNR
jgi:hypothetical protein